MLNPQTIIDDIEDDFRVGNVTMPLYVDVCVMPDDYGPYEKNRFMDDPDKLVAFLFDISLSRKIITFQSIHENNEIAVNGYDCAVVGYELHAVRCKGKEKDSNITPELIEALASTMTREKYVKTGWFNEDILDDEEVKDE